MDKKQKKYNPNETSITVGDKEHKGFADAEFTSGNVFLPISFDLKCGAKVSGHITKWNKCKDPGCINCKHPQI